jgi:hypothetical protein
MSVVLLSVGSWLYSLSVQLAYSLGYRSASPRKDSLPEKMPDPTLVRKTDSPDSDATLSGHNTALYLTNNPLLGVQNARLRLEAHVTSLRNASILNLFAGICVAVVGISVLYTVFIDIEKFHSLSDKKINAFDFLIFSLLPRLSATLFIQIFAYFFLLMYRSNLSDVRYFQNEMSNLDIYGAAISLALRPDVSATQKSVISILLKVERNRVMNRNQKPINPADDAELHQKLLISLNQLTARNIRPGPKQGKTAE